MHVLRSIQFLQSFVLDHVFNHDYFIAVDLFQGFKGLADQVSSLVGGSSHPS